MVIQVSNCNFFCSPERKRRLIKPQLKGEPSASSSSSVSVRSTALRHAPPQMNGKAAETSSLVRTRSNRGITDVASTEQPSTSSGGKPLTIKPLITKPNTTAGSGKSGELLELFFLLAFFYAENISQHKCHFLENQMCLSQLRLVLFSSLEVHQQKIEQVKVCYLIQETSFIPRSQIQVAFL